MEGYNFLYDKLIDLADYERFKMNTIYSTVTPLTDLQYSYNTTTKLATLNKSSNAASSKSGFKVNYSGLQMGDVIEITLEVLNTSTARIKTEIHEVGYLKTVFASEKSDTWETIKFKHAKRWNSNLEIFFGFLDADVGTASLRNASIKVHTKTKPLPMLLKTLRDMSFVNSRMQVLNYVQISQTILGHYLSLIVLR